ncbi:MAG: hypothetical protein ACTHMS_20300 [Jatrophihabitans sp.]|uniref:hypothetical protein n=1 Tax=Jatrophihabitans sp. TaxID=1932789 RepID=UPI003F7DF3BE
MDDWRLMGQERYLAGRTFQLRAWWPYREGWDHDHCDFCQRQISSPLATDDDEAVVEGYVTEDGYHWVCEHCFTDFQERMDFRVAD